MSARLTTARPVHSLWVPHVTEVQGGQVQPEAGAGVAVEVDDPPVGGEGEAQPVVVDGLPVGGGYGGLDGEQQRGGAEQPAQQGSGGGHAADGYQTARPSTVRRFPPDGPSGLGRIGRVRGHPPGRSRGSAPPLLPELDERQARPPPSPVGHHPHERIELGPVVRYAAQAREAALGGVTTRSAPTARSTPTPGARDPVRRPVRRPPAGTAGTATWPRAPIAPRRGPGSRRVEGAAEASCVGFGRPFSSSRSGRPAAQPPGAEPGQQTGEREEDPRLDPLEGPIAVGGLVVDR